MDMRLPGATRFDLFLFVCLASCTGLSAQNSSCSIQPAPTDPASQAYRDKDYSKAAQLYAAAVQADPKDKIALAGQIRSLLRQHQVIAATTLAEAATAADPRSAQLATVLGEVRFRQGRLADAAHTYGVSLKLDPCLPRTHYDLFTYFWAYSMRATAYDQLQTAHQLAPDDPEIRLGWIQRLPLSERLSETDKLLATGKDTSTQEQTSLRDTADRLRNILAVKNRGCRLVSPAAFTSATLPFRYLGNESGANYHALGFDVKVNDKATARLQLDTGASGILLNRDTAAKAGLSPIVTNKLSGIGDQKQMDGFLAYADDLRIGTLEFENCLVEVSDKHSIVDMDGLIGADVFDAYHVQLDFPLRQMTLSPLPALPGAAAQQETSLNASGVGTAPDSTAEAANLSSETLVPTSFRYKDRYIATEMQSWSPFASFSHHILISGKLQDGSPRLFLVDSGSNVTFLSTTAAKSVTKIHPDTRHHMRGINGQVDQLYTADHVDVIFANLRAPLDDALVMNLDRLSNSRGTEVSGILGLDTLKLLIIDIDYRDGLIHLAFDRKHGANPGYSFAH